MRCPQSEVTWISLLVGLHIMRGTTDTCDKDIDRLLIFIMYMLHTPITGGQTGFGHIQRILGEFRTKKTMMNK